VDPVGEGGVGEVGGGDWGGLRKMLGEGWEEDGRVGEEVGFVVVW